MYQVLVDGELFCDSRVDDLAIINPIVNLEANKAGSFKFTIPPKHPYYSNLKERTSLVSVYRDEELLFEGVCTEYTDDFYNQRAVTCEGSLSFLNDSIQRQAKIDGLTVRQVLEKYIANHNAMTDDFKHFTVGEVTVTDSTNAIYCYTNYNSTMTEIKEDLVDDLGGYLRTRLVDGVRYLDYIAESPRTCSQIIKLGENLIDFESNLDTTDIVTALIPLGASLDTQTVEGLDDYLTIKSVNSGKDYIESTAISTFGRIEAVQQWNNVTDASILKTKGEKYLSDVQFANVSIEAQAVDLHLDDESVQSFRLLDQIRVLSAPHGLDKMFTLTKMKINLNNPGKDTITLGKTEKQSLTASSVSADKAVLKKIEAVQPSQILIDAKENASALIKAGQEGYVTITTDDDGHPTEILIMDTNDKATATKVWRWNSGGFGYSSTGYEGTYGTAITMDGAIVADYITTGILNGITINGCTINIKNGNSVIGTWGASGLTIKQKVPDEDGNYYYTDFIVASSTDGGGTLKLGPNSFVQIYGQVSSRSGELVPYMKIGSKILIGDDGSGYEQVYAPILSADKVATKGNSGFRIYRTTKTVSLSSAKTISIITNAQINTAFGVSDASASNVNVFVTNSDGESQATTNIIGAKYMPTAKAWYGIWDANTVGNYTLDLTVIYFG